MRSANASPLGVPSVQFRTKRKEISMRHCGVCGSNDQQPDERLWRQDAFGVWYCWACQTIPSVQRRMSVTLLVPWLLVLAALVTIVSFALQGYEFYDQHAFNPARAVPTVDISDLPAPYCGTPGADPATCDRKAVNINPNINPYAGAVNADGSIVGCDGSSVPRLPPGYHLNCAP
jgi:hypothetical protein